MSNEMVSDIAFVLLFRGEMSEDEACSKVHGVILTLLAHLYIRLLIKDRCFPHKFVDLEGDVDEATLNRVVQELAVWSIFWKAHV